MPNVPTLTPGPDDTEHSPEGATETIPLIKNVHADKQSERTNDTAEISDEEAYAKLKAKRAERRRKKLIRRGIAAGVVGVIALIAIIATLVINAQPQGTSGPVTDMVTEGTFTTTVEAKGQLKPISSSVVSPSVDGTVDSINVQAGQSVNEGDVLMTIKNDELDRNVAEAQRAVAAAQEDLANAQKAVAAGLHLQQAVAAAQQPRLEHLRHDRVARAVFLVVKPERLGLVQPDVRLLGGRLRRLHPAAKLAKQRLDHLRLVHPVGQAHLVGARQLAQLHHRHVLIYSCGFQFDFSSSQWANMLCRGVSRGCAFMVKDMPKSIKIYVI